MAKKMKGKLNKVENGWVLLVDNIIYATDKDLLSERNCKSIEMGYDIDQLAEEFAKTHSIYPTAQDDTEYGFKYGFLKCLEIMSDLKFTSDDLLKAFAIGVFTESSKSDYTKEYEEYLESFNRSEWEVEIETEPYYDGDFIDDGKTHIIENKYRPKKDKDGFLILKLI